MVVTTILATLATTTLVTLNPTELLAQMRDSQRITTIGMLRDAVSLLVADRPATSLAVTNLVHISLPSTRQNCDDIVGLPALPAGQTYRCVTAENLTRIDGGGWIPLDFRGITDGSPFATLPVDPINTSTSFYSFTTAPGGRATIAARIESMRQRTIHPPGADGISIFATHFTAAVDRPPLGIGQVAVPLGSAGAPSYSFVGDLNTGIFSPLADNIGFSTAGAERMRIDDIGRVGIGTSAPGERLTVAGIIHSTIGGIRFPDGTLQATAGGATGPGGALPTGTAGQTLRHSGTAWVADSNLFNTGTNVGIGTTSPGARLSITTTGTELGGNAASTALRTMAGSLGTTAGNELALANIGFTSHNHSSLGIRAHRTVAGTDWTTTAIGLGMDVDHTVRAGANIWLHANGNVGIGTTGPGHRLDVVGDIRAQGSLRTTGNTGWINDTHGGGWFMQDATWIRTHGDRSVWTGGGQLGSHAGLTVGYGGHHAPAGGAIIAGNVGIGTSAPGARLDIAGGYTTTGLGAPAGLGIAAGGTSPDRAQIFWGDNTGWRLNFGTRDHLGVFQPRVTFVDTGNVGIGTTAPASVAGVHRVLEIAGPNHAGILLTDLDAGAGKWEIWNDGGFLRFWRSGTGHAIDIAPTGNVGIGTTAPGHRLDVVGDIRAQGWLRTTGNTGWINDTHGGGWFMSDATWIRTHGDRSVWTGGGQLGSQAGLTVGYGGAAAPAGGAIIAGNVGIGTTGPTARLHVAGNIIADAPTADNHVATRGWVLANNTVVPHIVTTRYRVTTGCPLPPDGWCPLGWTIVTSWVQVCYPDFSHGGALWNRSERHSLCRHGS